ncbi:MAG: ribosome maturation factor RimM [Arenicellaceae bacterium]|nr:ribosome maturation factor RimM [Arenicellaceae bacterium]
MSASHSGETAEAIELGKVSGVWGVRGAVKVYSYTREREGIAQYKNWILQSASGVNQHYEVVQCKKQGQSMVATLKGVDNRDLAESLQGFLILIPLQDMPVLLDGEYYWRQLVGLEVVTLEGEVLGIVDHLLETGANDVLVVQRKSPDSEELVEYLLPYIDQVVIEVDLPTKSMRVDWDPEF